MDKRKKGIILIFVVLFLIVGFIRGCNIDPSAELQGIIDKFERLRTNLSEVMENCETRAAWIDHDTAYATDEKISQSIAKILSLNLNTVFVQAPKVYDNFSYVNLDQEKEQFNKFIISAAENGISTHAWIESGHRLGENVQADYSVQTEREEQKKWVFKLLKEYPQLDGVQLDYIRYTDAQDVNLSKMDGVTETVRYIYNGLENDRNFEGSKVDFRHKFLTAAVWPVYQVDWSNNFESSPQWWKDWINQNPLSAQQPWYEHLTKPRDFFIQQDAVTWVKNGIVDSIFVMYYPEPDINTPAWYTQPQERFEEEINRWKKLVQGEAFAKFGIVSAWYQERDQNYFDPVRTSEKFKNAQAQGVKNLGIFKIYSQDPDPMVGTQLVEKLINEDGAPFKNPAPSCINIGQSLE